MLFRVQPETNPISDIPSLSHVRMHAHTHFHYFFLLSIQKESFQFSGERTTQIQERQYDSPNAIQSHFCRKTTGRPNKGLASSSRANTSLPSTPSSQLWGPFGSAAWNLLQLVLSNFCVKAGPSMLKATDKRGEFLSNESWQGIKR